MPVLPFVFCALVAPQEPSRYPVFETDNLSPAIYRQRREALKKQLGSNGVALITTNPTRNRANDTDYRFHADPDFSYLTGFDEPDASLLLIPSGVEVNGKRVTEVLFVNVTNPMSETWEGYRMGPAGAMNLLGVDAAVPNTEFDAVIKRLPSGGVVAGPPDAPPDLSGTVQMMATTFAAWTKSVSATKPTTAIPRLVAQMRVKKSPEEIVLLRHAVDASVLAHAEALRSVEPGMREYHLQALVEYVFARNGCEFVAYPSIVGSGPNGCILHYETNRRSMKAGDLVVMDVAGEYHGYAADVTRTFPVNGKFSPEQKAIYELVLAAQNAGIAQCKAGKPFRAPHEAAAKVLGEGMVRLGIISDTKQLGRYFMHGTSHYIGLDVHDAHGDNTLQANYALTVEPGIYIREGAPCDKKWWNIGVRIEDDILVTSAEPINMSGALPRDVASIEALMREKGVGNIPIKLGKQVSN